MKAKRILTYLLIILSLCLAITACAHKADDREPDSSEETSSPSSQTTTKPGETDPILTDPEDTETTGDGGPTDAPETSGQTQKSTSPTPVSQTKTQASSRSQTSSTVILPTYTYPTYTLPTYTIDFTTRESTPAKTTAKNLSKEYEAIHKDYANRLRKQTPVLIQEYKKEAEANTQGSFGLLRIQTQKVAALTQTEAEGTADMTFLRLQTNGDADDPEFDKWAGKLGSVYLEELAKLRAAFD